MVLLGRFQWSQTATREILWSQQSPWGALWKDWRDPWWVIALYVYLFKCVVDGVLTKFEGFPEDPWRISVGSQLQTIKDGFSYSPGCPVVCVGVLIVLIGYMLFLRWIQTYPRCSRPCKACSSWGDLIPEGVPGVIYVFREFQVGCRVFDEVSEGQLTF